MKYTFSSPLKPQCVRGYRQILSTASWTAALIGLIRKFRFLRKIPGKDTVLGLIRAIHCLYLVGREISGKMFFFLDDRERIKYIYIRLEIIIGMQACRSHNIVPLLQHGQTLIFHFSFAKLRWFPTEGPCKRRSIILF